MSCGILNAIAVAVALVSLSFAADKPAANKKYQAYLSPMPHNGAMHPNFSGKGNAIATLAGDTMSLSGAFTGLASPATKALVDERKGIPDDDPYHHPYIPRLARSTLPLLKRALAEGESAFKGFSKDYIRAGEAELGDEVSSPKFLLSAVALVSSAKNKVALVGAFFKELQPTFYCGQSDLQYFSDVSAVRFLTYDEVQPVGEDFLTNAAQTSHRGFAYAVRRGTEARTYYLVGRDTDAVMDVVKHLASIESAAAEGLLFRIE
jgi:hypothetical protein